MPFRIGCDLVLMKTFESQFLGAGSLVLETVFWPAEYFDQPVAALAGIFAAKEAACKALSLPPGHWLDLCVERAPSGEPRMIMMKDLPEVESIRVSITHAGDYALAFVVVQTRC
jgi:phosphopantetheine--protein transferase-like protein